MAKERIYWVDAQNNTLELTDSSQYFIQSRVGFGMVKATIYEERVPGMPGTFFLDQIPEARIIKIGLKAKTTLSDLPALRDSLITTFNPRLGAGVLRVVRVDGTTREIHCLCSEPLDFPRTVKSGLNVIADVITLKAFNPFWYDPSPENATQILGTGSVFALPITLPVTFAQGETSSDIVLINNGQEAAPVYVQYTGIVSNPKILNVTTGKLIQINITLGATDVLRIGSGPWDHYVTKVASGVSTNQIGYMSDDSDLIGFMAQPGSNTFRFYCTGASSLVTVLQFNPYYRGI